MLAIGDQSITMFIITSNGFHHLLCRHECSAGENSVWLIRNYIRDPSGIYTSFPALHLKVATAPPCNTLHVYIIIVPVQSPARLFFIALLYFKLFHFVPSFQTNCANSAYQLKMETTMGRNNRIENCNRSEELCYDASAVSVSLASASTHYGCTFHVTNIPC